MLVKAMMLQYFSGFVQLNRIYIDDLYWIDLEGTCSMPNVNIISTGSLVCSNLFFSFDAEIMICLFNKPWQSFIKYGNWENRQIVTINKPWIFSSSISPKPIFQKQIESQEMILISIFARVEDMKKEIYTNYIKELSINWVLLILSDVDQDSNIFHNDPH